LLLIYNCFAFNNLKSNLFSLSAALFGL